jgi:hypothetical protein
VRMMLRWTVPVEKGNDAIQDGSLTRTIETLLEMLQPEAAYFFAEAGERGGLFVFDMADSLRIPEIAEPLFQNHDAAVEFLPVMNTDDLKAAMGKFVSG